LGGIVNDESDEQSRKTWFSMRESAESGSNVIVERVRQSKKEYEPSCSTEEGM
jgi:hypothetical protein